MLNDESLRPEYLHESKDVNSYSMHPSVKYVLSLWITINIQVRAYDLVTEYLLHKNVWRVTIFSCGQTESDFRFVRRMNAFGYSVAVIRPDLAFFNESAKMLRKDNWPVGIFLDTRCQTRAVNEKIIAQTSEYQLYETIHVWLILGTSLEQIMQLANDSAYSLLTDLVVGVKTEIGYDLYDFYNPCKIRGGTLTITTLGYWNVESGLNITLNQNKFDRRSNLQGMKLKVAAVMKYRPPGMKIEDHLQDDTKKSQDPITKYGYAVLRQIAELYNFTMDLQPVEEWIANVNGTEIGAMPALARGEVDTVASPVSATLRFAAKPYGRILMPGYPYRTFFVFRSSVQKVKWTEHFNPFARDSWLATIFTTILCIVIIATIQTTEYRHGWWTEARHAIFVTLGIMCQQGLVSVPNRLAGRAASIFLLLYGILLSNYYAASVVSSRLQEPIDKMTDSLYALAKSNMIFASEAYRNVDDNLASRSASEWEVRYFYEKIWTKLPISKYAPIDESLRKAGQGGFAYHTSAEVAYPYIGKHWDDKAICDMTEVHVITPRVMSFYGRVDSPFTEIMKIGLLKTANMGLQMRTLKLWKPKVPECSTIARSMQSITFFEIAPAVMMIFGGAVLALIIYFVERIVYTSHRSRDISKSKKKKQRTVRNLELEYLYPFKGIQSPKKSHKTTNSGNEILLIKNLTLKPH